MWRTGVIILIALLGLIFATVAVHYSERNSLPALAEAYVDIVPRELGAPNVITGILLTYRAFDTLGEVAVLFMVAAGIGLLLGAGGEKRDAHTHELVKVTPSTEIVRNGADILVPLIAIFPPCIVPELLTAPDANAIPASVPATAALVWTLTMMPLSRSVPKPLGSFWLVVVPVQVTVVLVSGAFAELAGSQAASARSLIANGEINGASAMAYRSMY